MGVQVRQVVIREDKLGQLMTHSGWLDKRGGRLHSPGGFNTDSRWLVSHPEWVCR